MFAFTNLRRFIVCAIVISLAAQPALAWNDKGHMVVARIAYEQLSDAQRAAVHKLLWQHPHYESYLAKDRPEEASEAEWVFLRAATWCDNIRPPKGFAGNIATDPKYKFHRGPWHYMDYEYRPGITKSERIEIPAATDILKQLTLSMAVLKGTETTDPGVAADVSPEANRAVRLCWLFHLVGDLHQPLHSTALVDPQKFPVAPHGDDGGNRIAVRGTNYPQPIKLHAYWDQLLGIDAFFPIIRKMASDIAAEPGATRTDMQTRLQLPPFVEWTYESNDQAKQYVYSDGNLKFAVSDDFEKKRITADDVPMLADEYEKTSALVARRQAALAGYRLAKCLQETFP